MSKWPRTSRTPEEIEDVVGGMAGMSVTYDDVNGTLDVSANLSTTSPSDISGSRTVATQYTNSTGNPLFVSAQVGGDGVYVRWDVSGAILTQEDAPSGAFYRVSTTAIVPAGETYQLSTDGSLSRWFEQELSV